MDTAFLTGIAMKKTPIIESPRKTMKARPSGPRSTIGAIMCTLQKGLIKSHSDWAKMLEISFIRCLSPR